MTEGTQEHIADGQEHHAGESHSSDVVQRGNHPKENAK
jgi:hypothetical protein